MSRDEYSENIFRFSHLLISPIFTQLVDVVLYWQVSISLILKDQSGIICDQALDISEVSQAVKRGDRTHQSDHDHLEFAWPKTALDWGISNKS